MHHHPGGGSDGGSIGTGGTSGSNGGYTGREEIKEWSQACWVWQQEKSSSGGMLSKTPLIREVPSVMKRKMGGKRDSSQLLSPDSLPSFDDMKGGKTGSLREKASRSGFGIGPVSSSKDGQWKRVVGVLRDDGYFRIFSEESVVLQSIHLPSIQRTDVRAVDQSLFGRPHVVVIHRRGSVPGTPSTSYSAFSSSSSVVKSAEEPIYLCMPSIVAMETWIVMAHCFARPEFLSSPMIGPSSPPHPTRPDTTSWAAEDDSQDEDNAWEEVDTRCRIFRTVALSINEGRGIGEAGTEVIRPGPKQALDRRPDLEREFSNASSDTFSSLGSDHSPSKPLSSARLHRASDGPAEPTQGFDTFCEVVLDGDVVARTSVRKSTTSPFWNESFVFRDLPPIVTPVVIKIFQHHKSSRPTLIGSSIVRIPDHPRAQLIEDWWPVKPASHDIRGRQTDTVGELSLSVKVNEDVVLPSSEYATMLALLNDDPEAELAVDLAHEFPTDLEEVARILLRIYQAESQLIPRILRLTELEIEGGDTRSAAILFRGNSILTKSIELYLRLVGAEYLDLSIGEPIRRLCASKVEIEIDPSKMKHGAKEKDLTNNVHELHEWTTAVWNSIYDAREKCPNEVRIIFANIQKVVAAKYGDGETEMKMRSTSVSAFIFLRFFVPAVLNPKLFNLISSPPDPKSQRTLTLVAKTLQGLANFSTFGQKEPWMLPMNSFVQGNMAAFVDFIRHISTPSATARYEWTSPHAAVYLAPYRLRKSLSPSEEVKSRARAATVRSPWTHHSQVPFSPATPPKGRNLADEMNELHIRASPGSPTSAGSPSSASRRSHRSFTVSGVSPRAGSSHSHSKSSEDLLMEPAPILDIFQPRQPAPSPIPDADSDSEDDSPRYVFPSRPGTSKASSIKGLQESIETASRKSTDSGSRKSVSTEHSAEASPSLSSPGPQFTSPFAPASVSMAMQKSTSSQATTSSSTSTISLGDVTLGQVIATGRKPSQAGMMGVFMGEDPFAEGGKKRSILARMGRKNSKAG
ncbi:Ras GTPase-activating protein 1 [Pseudohyphozyma bogoriensis]|nr:Ras GTPase-activating protein 1 [Pseudohyphozyma bogoriensis]